MLPLKSWLSRWLDRIGRRGAFVILMGALFSFLGLGEILDPSIGEPSRIVLHRFLPGVGWGIIFLVTGIIAFVEGIWRRKNNNVISITTMSVLASIWATGTFAAGIVGVETTSESIVGGVVWLLLTGIIQIIAGWPDYGNNVNLGD